MAKRPIDYDFLFKTIIIGDSSVGKSSIMLRQCDDIFNSSYISTIGVDFRYNIIDINGKKVKLQIWDTAGQERFRTITAAYYRSSDIAIVVFDVTNRTSFNNVNRWIEECKKNANMKIKLFLIGNKCDASNREISKEEAIKCAEHFKINYMETSAKTGFGIEEAFKIIGENAINMEISPNIHNKTKNSTINPNINSTPSTKKSFCNLL
jgi:small GTP-binding protein